MEGGLDGTKTKKKKEEAGAQGGRYRVAGNETRHTLRDVGRERGKGERLSMKTTWGMGEQPNVPGVTQILK